jgi:hypothetical protein
VELDVQLPPGEPGHERPRAISDWLAPVPGLTLVRGHNASNVFLERLLYFLSWGTAASSPTTLGAWPASQIPARSSDVVRSSMAEFRVHRPPNRSRGLPANHEKTTVFEV